VAGLLLSNHGVVYSYQLSLSYDKLTSPKRVQFSTHGSSSSHPSPSPNTSPKKPNLTIRTSSPSPALPEGTSSGESMINNRPDSSSKIMMELERELAVMQSNYEQSLNQFAASSLHDQQHQHKQFSEDALVELQRLLKEVIAFLALNGEYLSSF
jgi:hypothetical protein